LDNVRRRNRLFQSHELSLSRVLEIGPLDRPIVTQEMADVTYVDHLSTSELRQKYLNDPVVDQSGIVPVDIVWNGSLLKSLTGMDKFNYIVASHLIEHVPDFVTFMQETSALITPTGALFLVIPDKNFTFDYLRNVTIKSDVLANYLEKETKPTTRQILDDLVFSSDWKIEDGWSKNKKRVPNLNHTVERAINIAKYTLEANEYFDVHTWVFTPESFTQLIQELRDLGLIDWKIKNLILTAHSEFEFYCVLEK
jgi:hypothetical protein